MAQNSSGASSSSTPMPSSNNNNSNNNNGSVPYSTTTSRYQFLPSINVSKYLMEPYGGCNGSNVMTSSTATAAGTHVYWDTSSQNVTRYRNDLMASNIPSQSQNMEESSLMEHDGIPTDSRPSYTSSQYQMDAYSSPHALSGSSKFKKPFPPTSHGEASNSGEVETSENGSGDGGVHLPQIYEIDSQYCIEI